MNNPYFSKLVLLVILISNYSFGQQTYSRVDSIAMNKISNDFEVAFNTHNSKALSELFIPNGEFTNIVGASVKGRNAIEDFHAPMFEGKPGYFSFKYSTLKNKTPKISFIKPDVASVDILWTLDKCYLPDGTEAKNRAGLITLLLVKENQKWEIAVMHNAELPHMNN